MNKSAKEMFEELGFKKNSCMKCIIISYVYGEERGGDRMHYKGHIVTKEIPSEENLKNILEKYYYKNVKDEDKFEYDYYIVG